MLCYVRLYYVILQVRRTRRRRLHTCHILPRSEIDWGAVFGCFYRLGRETPISQNRPKGQNMATTACVSLPCRCRCSAILHVRRTRLPACRCRAGVALCYIMLYYKFVELAVAAKEKTDPLPS